MIRLITLWKHPCRIPGGQGAISPTLHRGITILWFPKKDIGIKKIRKPPIGLEVSVI
jgi:hypothetical protein